MDGMKTFCGMESRGNGKAAHRRSQHRALVMNLLPIGGFTGYDVLS
jgi:hypothetical protein